MERCPRQTHDVAIWRHFSGDRPNHTASKNFTPAVCDTWIRGKGAPAEGLEQAIACRVAWEIENFGVFRFNKWNLCPGYSPYKGYVKLKIAANAGLTIDAEDWQRVKDVRAAENARL